MIHTVTGTILSQKKQAIVVALGPIGVECAVPDESLFPAGTQKTVHTHLHWNQEQGPSLYGFASDIDRSIFLLVTSCSGVGPRLGLAVLADLGAQSFMQAVTTGDEKLLSQVSGIGAKKAEQMIVQLKHKVQQMIDAGFTLSGENQTEFQTVIEALRALNYSRSEVTKAVEFVRSKTSGASSFDQLMRHALAYLSKQPN
jgi:Holliday junction DNA helicase RuvA